MRLSKQEVLAALESVCDPELGMSVVAMGLLDRVEVKGEEVEVEYHLTTPFCPYFFAKQIGIEIKERIKSLGAKQIKVKLRDHFMADVINQELERV